MIRFRCHSGMYQLPFWSNTTPIGLSMEVTLAGPPGGWSPPATFSMVAALNTPQSSVPTHNLPSRICSPPRALNSCQPAGLGESIYRGSKLIPAYRDFVLSVSVGGRIIFHTSGVVKAPNWLCRSKMIMSYLGKVEMAY